MSKKRFEEIVSGVGILVYGIILIILGTAINDKIWFTVLMTICGTTFSIYALQYLKRKRH